jgi:hypothetical protein
MREVIMVRIHDDGSVEDEALVREGGVFVSRSSGREVDAREARAADDYIEDPGTGDAVPGTVDDLPYDQGLETARAADSLLTSSGRGRGAAGGIGRTGADDDREPPELGGPEERELWKKQRGLIGESKDEDARYAGLSDDLAARLDAASCEDAADTLPDSPEGTSATGGS